MKIRTYTLRSLLHYWPTSLGAIAGTALVAFVLAGAFLVRHQAHQRMIDLTGERIGAISFAMQADEIPFRVALAEQVADRTGMTVAPVLMVRGSIALPGGTNGACYAPVLILGVDHRFWQLSPGGKAPSNTTGVIVNDELCRTIRLEPGQDVVIRAAPLDALAPETGLNFDRRGMLALRMRISGHAGSREFGRFSLKNQPLAEPIAFVPLAELQQALKATSHANLALFCNHPSDPVTLAEMKKALALLWTLEDIGLEIRDAGANLELRTPRIFLPAAVGTAVLRAVPEAQGILTYFVTSITHGQDQTPYSTISALPAELLGYTLRDDEIVINEWLARDLRAAPGSRLSLTFYTIAPNRRLVETNAWFEVKAIVGMQSPLVDRTLTPGYPGMQTSPDCRDWQPDLPIDLSRIRAQDEIYWDQYQASPKAGISLAAGRRIWGNPFGDLTAIRVKDTPGSNYKLVKAIRKNTTPTALGIHLISIRRFANQSVTQAMDAGQIFLGLSLFLIIAALIMASSLWHLHVAARTPEIGLFRATGFTPWRISRMFGAEVAIIAIAGVFTGAVASMPYGMRMVCQIELATSADPDAGMVPIGLSLLQWGIPVLMPVMGIVLIVALGMAGFGIWRTMRQQPRTLMSGIPSTIRPARTRTHLGIVIATAVLAITAIGITAYGWLTARVSVAHFIWAGIALLGVGFGLAYHLLAPDTPHAKPAAFSLYGLSWAHARRARWRSLAVVMLMACGIFLVVVVGASPLDRDYNNPAIRRRHLGNFDLLVTLSQPLTAIDQQRLFSAAMTNSMKIVMCRLSDGDNASCLNPARSVNPQLLGIPPGAFEDQQAFTFIRTIPELAGTAPWLRLDRRLADGAIPAVVDAATLEWGLGKRLGDNLLYQDQNGTPVRVRIAGVIDNSFLQGHVIISDANFIALVPASRGMNVMLVKYGQGITDSDTENYLRGLLGRHGVAITTTAGRFEQLALVETVYRGLFGVLGSLGLILGAAGLGFMLLRNIMERRAEVALLRAIGYTAARIQQLILVEHINILALGVGTGLVASLVAAWPSLILNGNPALALSIALTRVGLILCGGIIAIILSSLWVTRLALLRALRSE